MDSLSLFKEDSLSLFKELASGQKETLSVFKEVFITLQSDATALRNKFRTLETTGTNLRNKVLTLETSQTLATNANKVLHDELRALDTRVTAINCYNLTDYTPLISTSIKSAACAVIPSVIYDSNPQSIMVIVDTGTSTHSVPVPSNDQTRTPCAPTTVTLPDGTQLTSTYTVHLPIPELPAAATRAHVLPGFHQHLLSVGQLCDHGCIAILDKQQVLIVLNDKIIVNGHRDPRTGLYTAILRPTTSQVSSELMSSELLTASC